MNEIFRAEAIMDGRRMLVGQMEMTDADSFPSIGPAAGQDRFGTLKSANLRSEDFPKITQPP